LNICCNHVDLNYTGYFNASCSYGDQRSVVAARAPVDICQR
jgi:hypothetical protein